MTNRTQWTSSQIAAEYGFSSRYWIKQAAAGKVPGARQPSGPGGQWLFDHADFTLYWSGCVREVVEWRPPVKTVGRSRAPVVTVEMSAAARRQRTEELLRRAGIKK